MRRSSDFLSAKSCLVYGKSGQRAPMNLSSVHTLQGPKPKCEPCGTLSLKSVQVSLYFFICVSPFNYSVQILTLFWLNLSSFMFCHLNDTALSVFLRVKLIFYLQKNKSAFSSLKQHIWTFINGYLSTRPNFFLVSLLPTIHTLILIPLLHYGKGLKKRIPAAKDDLLKKVS